MTPFETPAFTRTATAAILAEVGTYPNIENTNCTYFTIFLYSIINNLTQDYIFLESL